MQRKLFNMLKSYKALRIYIILYFKTFKNKI